MLHLKNLDVGSTVVISITFALFALALVIKGFTHGLLLEAGVFLVSVKLIFMSYKSNAMKRSMEAKLDAIYDALLKSDECKKSEELRAKRLVLVGKRAGKRRFENEESSRETRG